MSKYRRVIYSCAFLFCLGVADLHAIAEKESEVKDVNEPVRRLNYHRTGNNNGDNFFQRPFDNAATIDFNTDTSVPNDESSALFSRRPVFSSQDEEERFFLARETTTLNPLSFFTTQTTTTTIDPIEQQRIDEQRRFQEEIANKGLREQQQRSFGLRTTSTTTTTPSSPSTDFFLLDQLQSSPDSFLEQIDSTFPNTESIPESLLELNNLRSPPGRFSQNERAPLAQSYSFVRTFRRRRAIDRQQASENEVPVVADLMVSSTVSPQQALVNSLLQDVNPREDLAKIGGWLFENLAKTVERNIAHRSIVKPPPYSTPANFFLPAYKSTPRLLKSISTPAPEPPSNYLTQEYHSSPRPVKNLVLSEPTPNFFQEYQTTTKSNNNFASVESSPNYFQEYQSTPKPIGQFVSPELPPNLIPITYAQTTPKIDFSQFQWNVSPTISYDPNLMAHSQSPVSYVASTSKPSDVALPLIVIPQGSVSSTTLLPKIRNIQILPVPSSTPAESFSVKPYESSVFQAGEMYNIQPQMTPRSIESTTVYVHPSIATSTENTASVTSLFKAKMNGPRNTETHQPSTMQKGFTETQPNQFFDLLAQSNVTASPGIDSASNSPVYPTTSTAIFVKVPENEPSSTAGYIFDKPIVSAKYKKENNYESKKNNRSPQMLKSTLVYRTPPGKRATLTRSEVARNEQMEAGLLSHILEAQGKPISSWLLGQARQSTTSRPLVSALMNLIRKRSPAR